MFFLLKEKLFGILSRGNSSSPVRVITEAEFIQLARYPFIRFQFDHWSAKIAVNPRAIRASN